MEVDLELVNGRVVEDKYDEDRIFSFQLPISTDLLNTNTVLKEECINFRVITILS